MSAPRRQTLLDPQTGASRSLADRPAADLLALLEDAPAAAFELLAAPPDEATDVQLGSGASRRSW